jgi:hypothetical protein
MANTHIDASVEREWKEAESLLTVSPGKGLKVLDQIAGDLLRANGYELGAASGNEVDMDVIARVDDPELLMGYIEAHAVTEMLATGRTTGRETIDLAHEAYGTIYDSFAGRA